MNKKEYLSELEKALKNAHVCDSNDILEEYSEHFNMKTADGYSEEEIAARLAKPRDIAAQYKGIGQSGKTTNAASRLVLVSGLVFADIVTGIFFAVMYVFVLVFGAVSTASVAIGSCLAARINTWSLIPHMPYSGALLLGLAFLSLAVLSAVGTVYYSLFITQLLKAYTHWHRAVLDENRQVSLPVPKYPVLGAKRRRHMRNAVLASLAVFALCITVGFVLLSITAGAIEFWHVWHWFE